VNFLKKANTGKPVGAKPWACRGKVPYGRQAARNSLYGVPKKPKTKNSI